MDVGSMYIPIATRTNLHFSAIVPNAFSSASKRKGHPSRVPLIEEQGGGVVDGLVGNHNALGCIEWSACHADEIHTAAEANRRKLQCILTGLNRCLDQ